MPSAVQGRSSRMQDTRTIRTFVQDSERSSKREERTLAREVDVRPETSGRSSSMQSERSSKCERERTLVPGRGRSSKRADVRPGGRSSEDARPRSGRSTHRRRQQALVQEADARPARQKWTLVQPGRGRSSKRADVRPGGRSSEDARPRSGRSSKRGDARPEAAGARPRSRRSSSQAEVDARPARQRTFVQNARPEDRTLVQPDTRDARPCRRNERTLVHARGRSSMQEDVRPAEVDVRPLSVSLFNAGFAC
ncbi:hypothetical protein LR48_Vigan11g113000 [Vigna angularis]|uniref:Uncharacterized protein n=1 Tax=Phaseolus angularis TaxID=3914 RepID=A0A0L9VSN6_PHAAN|nr:hypothetical protein LR48_Vigan11g113000 [Vigna angularis]